MNKDQISGRLSWLADALAVRRNDIASAFLRLKGLGVQVRNSLSFPRHFVSLMEQIAADREKELDILHEIETIEKKHDELKTNKLLRTASPAPLPQVEPLSCEDNEEKPDGFGLTRILALLAFFSSSGGNHKKQDLTVD